MAVVPSGRFTKEGKPIFKAAPTKASIARKVSEKRVQKFRSGKKISDTQRVKVTRGGEEIWVTPSQAQAISKEGSKQFIEAQQKQAEIEKLKQAEIKKAGEPTTEKPTKQLTPAQKVLALEVGRQRVIFSEKALELLGQRQLEEARKVTEPTRAEITFRGGRVKAEGVVSPAPELQPTPKKEIEGPEIFLDPEIARKVRKQLAQKEIQKTIIKVDLPDLRGIIIPKKRFSVIDIDRGVPPTGLITTETELIKFFQTKKRIEAKGLLEKIQVIVESPAEVGVSLEKEGASLVGAGLIFVGKTTETAFGISPPGIILSIKERGLTETLEQFTGIPLIQAVRGGKLLQATTPLGRLAEAGGITTGVIIGSRITKASVKGAGKTIKFIQKESARLREPGFQPEVRAEKVKGFEPVGKGQQKFVKLTESGQEIPQFQETFPEVTRVIISKKTGKILRIIDPISGKVIRSGIPKDIQKTLDIQTKELIITEKTFVARELGPIPGREPIPKFKPEPPGKQIKLTKDFGEGFLNKELFDIEFEVPTSPPSRFLKFIRGKKAGLLLETPEFKFKAPSAFETDLIAGIREPTISALLLIPPEVREKKEPKLKPGIDIDLERELERERERGRGQISPPIIKGLQIKELKPSLDKELKQIGKAKLKPDIRITEQPITEQERKQEREIIIIPDIGIEPDQRLKQELEQEIILDIPKPPAIPKVTAPLLPPMQERRFKEEESDLFFAHAKEKGKFVKLNKKALPMNKALNLMGDVVDNTPSATGKLVKADKKGKDVLDDIGFNLRGKFTRKNNLYIEKNKHRIDSPGEIEGITVKGWLAQKRKGLRI